MLICSSSWPSMSKLIVAVTGANGFVGTHVIAALLEDGHTVRGCVRNPADTAKTAHLNSLPGATALTLVEGDLSVEGSYDAAFSGADAVVHTAAVGWSASKPVLRMVAFGQHTCLSCAARTSHEPFILSHALTGRSRSPKLEERCRQNPQAFAARLGKRARQRAPLRQCAAAVCAGESNPAQRAGPWAPLACLMWMGTSAPTASTSRQSPPCSLHTAATTHTCSLRTTGTGGQRSRVMPMVMLRRRSGLCTAPTAPAHFSFPSCALSRQARQ